MKSGHARGVYDRWYMSTHVQHKPKPCAAEFSTLFEQPLIKSYKIRLCFREAVLESQIHTKLYDVKIGQVRPEAVAVAMIIRFAAWGTHCWQASVFQHLRIESLRRELARNTRVKRAIQTVDVTLTPPIGVIKVSKKARQRDTKRELQKGTLKEEATELTRNLMGEERWMQKNGE